MSVWALSASISSVQANDTAWDAGPSPSLFSDREADSATPWLNSVVASGVGLTAVCLANYLGRHCDYLCPSNYFTTITPRRWKLPHEKYLEEQQANESPHQDVCLPAFDLEEED